MDYDRLYNMLPKQPTHWSTDDVCAWLTFISLDQLTLQFRRMAIDGNCLKLIRAADIYSNMNIVSQIQRKKLGKWIENGLKQFEEFVVNKKKGTYSTKSSNDMSMRRYHTSLMRDKMHPARQHSVSAFEEKAEPRQLLVTPYEGQSASFFRLGEKGAKIGKSPANSIPVFEQSVDAQHSEIIFFQDSFFLVDLGSRNGTFIKIRQKETLLLNMVLQMGSHLFVVVKVDMHQVVLNYQSSGDSPVKTIAVRAAPQLSYSIGRKATANLPLDDQHLSGIHAKLSYLNGIFVIEDMESTNGTWIRLSQPLQPSSPFLLEDKTVFKVGNTSTYTCRLKQTEEAPMMIGHRGCIMCAQPQIDAVVLPCKHKTTCYNCSQSINTCSICQTPISDIIKIFI